MKLFCLFCLLSGSILTGEDGEFSDDYNLYDRNKAGLDWNRPNYPKGTKSLDSFEDR